ncbi:MAG: diacylglycerol kinase family protein [Clostridia bacterium]|nr:diacylglycerol kinase family protein [Clostridia bacterium]
MKQYILFNPHAGNGTAEEVAKKLAATSSDSVLLNMTAIDGYDSLMAGVTAEDTLTICGGDGTLNRFINDTDEMEIPCEVYYLAVGSGNDFLRDLDKTPDGTPVCITQYIRNLPVTEVKGKTYRFLNNVGFGIDGYCCEEGDAQKAKSTKAVNYTAIAIKGLLFHYKPTSAVITVDGKEYRFKKVWLAPTMKGRYYGGGMMATPAQDRTAEDGKLSVLIFHGSSSLRTLMIFPSIFKGEHIKSEKFVTVLTGYDIKVVFDRPSPVQVDGETISGVTEYTATAKVPAPAKV